MIDKVDFKELEAEKYWSNKILFSLINWGDNNGFYLSYNE